MKNNEKLTERIRRVFNKDDMKTATEGKEPTFHTSRTYGGTIPYLPGKFREEYSLEHHNDEEVDKEHKSSKKGSKKTQSKSKNTKKNK